ncbi:MSHA biogenesis protein MshJ [Cellvibrio sp. pealriver]|uniref:MSHA biogenesis protein MshJ n=1 Tax=Cellvibrio sp. pealriver TaxID=1622269 RepID=UPI00066FD25B|nr:MSHA biogenesis protein MshJ [Cellvibrio sp. pealriver]
MSPAITQLMEKIDSRILSERVLIFLTSLAVIFLLWNFLVQARFDRERADLNSQLTQMTTEQKSQESQIATLTQTMASDPAIAKKNEINRLTGNIANIESQLSGLSQGLISAEQLPKVLQEVLLRTSSVTLLQVRTLAVTELQLAESPAVQNPQNSAASNIGSNTGGTGVYKHGVLIRVAGSYPQLIQLMKEIENLEWKFYWESLDYTVEQYPNATIDIRVFTLSSEEGLLGV